MPADQRVALLKSMATSLFIHEKILTTESKAKELRRFADKIITLAKEDTVARRREVQKVLPRPPLDGHKMQERRYREKEHPERDVLNKLFTEIAPRYQTRDGGYTRVLKAPSRRGDAAPMAIVMLTGTEAG
ncbi:MAG: 50S ribosomal protein L17 [Armatimonadetes bacterium CG2_30_59_28]|nr:MAG: 50S ribosomal protein L17 [Armatimonadetes bacterium CG2_30_59_28]